MPAAAIALIPQLIALIPVVTTGIESLLKFISSIRTAALQTGQWTPEMEKAFIDSLVALASSGAWKTDAQLAAK